MKRQLLAMLVLLVPIVAACTPATTVEPTAPPAPTIAPTVQPPTEPPAPTATTPPTDTPVPALPPPPPDPQAIEFEAEDGYKLTGTYFPAATNPAPIIVLFHWAGGTDQDWTDVGLVDWLRNRPGGALRLSAFAPQHASLYPPMPAGYSFAVFVFPFRSFEPNRVISWEPDGWLMDARAAIETARALPGVNPDRLGTMGASIGADAAVDVCAEGCVGALSFSPGSYLGILYSEAVRGVDERGTPSWCLASEGDRESAPMCNSASGDHYRSIIYPGNFHGMDLFQPGLDPEIGQTILDFLLTAFPTP